MAGGRDGSRRWRRLLNRSRRCTRSCCSCDRRRVALGVDSGVRDVSGLEIVVEGVGGINWLRGVTGGGSGGEGGGLWGCG